MRAARLIAAAIFLSGAVAPATAQRALTVAPLVSLAEHRVDAGFGVERSLGPILGAVGTLRLGTGLAVAVRALGGSLFGANGVLDRDVGELGVEGSVVTGPWLSLQAGAARRAYGTRLGRQTWTTVDIGAVARVAFAGGTIHAPSLAAVAWWAGASGRPLPGARLLLQAGDPAGDVQHLMRPGSDEVLLDLRALTPRVEGVVLVQVAVELEVRREAAVRVLEPGDLGTAHRLAVHHAPAERTRVQHGAVEQGTDFDPLRGEEQLLLRDAGNPGVVLALCNLCSLSRVSSPRHRRYRGAAAGILVYHPSIGDSR